ncbi:alcohol dehydrogenase catalytic domain-containing protein [Bombilactobacillus thymidiniphilus]|uniref:Alcohol dehydrogenase catalytic domain-containing protein n=1 Tax=Bombilactobacillus thymidiniphilus TaxID=2923363 RepID=A0ABY4PCL2_9LACO|nr:alcohol dehydrogenase catalytic domain-containing protein [Bombilactobacillus thymidiniphilus]UQS83408.1 alcohol dehydrogenase catalytic domain-containing protein [Bombilactobacillus thymidiniphilus]
MKAARIYGQKDLRIEDLDIEDPKADEVQIKVHDVGICGSDIHMYQEGTGIPYEKHPLTGKTVPITEGHEFSGEVVQIGSAVTNFAVGDHVCVEPVLACGKCEFCRKGLYNYCTQGVGPDGSLQFIGFSADGGMAELVNVNEMYTFKLPDGMDYELGALVEPGAVTYEAVRDSGLITGQTVAVLGAGPIGLLTALMAKYAGATKVYIADLVPERLAKAKELGFSDVINSAEVDIVEHVYDELPNGVDVVFECAGVQPTLNQAVQLVAPAGVLEIVALFNGDYTLDITTLQNKGVDVHTIMGYANCFPPTIGIINEHQATFKKLVTKRISLDQAEKGIKSLMTDKNQVKVMIEPQK